MSRDGWTCPACGRSFARRNQSHSCAIQTPGDLFRPYPDAARLYPKVLAAVGRLGDVEVAATKTQVSFRRPGGGMFAWLWVPAMALKRGASDLCLTFSLPAPVPSPRVKEATEVRPGRWVSHVRIAQAGDLDAEMRGWLAAAYDHAAPGEKQGAAPRARNRSGKKKGEKVRRRP